MADFLFQDELLLNTTHRVCRPLAVQVNCAVMKHKSISPNHEKVLSEYYIHIEHLHYLNLRYVKRRRSCLLHHKLPIFIIFIFRELLAIQNDSRRGFATAQPEKNPVMLNYNFFVCFLLFLEQ